MVGSFPCRNPPTEFTPRFWVLGLWGSNLAVFFCGVLQLQEESGERSLVKTHLEQWKKGPNGSLGLYRGWNPTQLCGNYFINHDIRISINPPGFNGKSFFFFGGSCMFGHLCWGPHWLIKSPLGLVRVREVFLLWIHVGFNAWTKCGGIHCGYQLLSPEKQVLSDLNRPKQNLVTISSWRRFATWNLWFVLKGDLCHLLNHGKGNMVGTFSNGRVITKHRSDKKDPNDFMTPPQCLKFKHISEFL